MGNVNISDVRKAEFEKWILENKTFSKKRVTKIIEHLQNMSSLNNGFPVFEINEVITLKEFKRSIMKTKYFRQLPRISRSEIGFNLDIYEEFLHQRAAKLTNDVLYKTTNKQTNMVAGVEDKKDYSKLQTSYQKIKKIDDASIVLNRDNLITEVLHDKKYKSLVDALRHDGIITLGQLIDINVISYVNSKNLYSWKERLAIWEGLKKILDSYRKTVEEKVIMQTSNAEVKELEEQSSTLREDKCFHKVDISNKKSYMNMKPQKFILQGKEFIVSCWIEVLIGVCEELFKRYPAQMTALIEKPVGRGERPLFGRNRKWYSKVLKNGLCLDARHSATSVLNNARAVCKKCGIDPEELEVFVEKEKSLMPNPKINEDPEHLSVITDDKNSNTSNSTKERADIERIIKECGLTGCSLQDIQQYFPLKKKTIVDIIVEDNNIIEIGKDKYIYRDIIVDLDEAGDSIKSILIEQFEQFDGYSSNRLLYDAVRIDLSLFLNDNDFDDIDVIYYLAKHLFSKENFGGENYVFYGNMHIWQHEPDYPKSVKGLLIHYARMAQNSISLEECESFLKKLGLSATNVKQLMQITLEPTFLQYDEAKYLLAETLYIDEQWTNIIAKGIGKLFDDNDYVIIRDIQKEWYEALPSLPFGLPWTRLLLQEILGYYPEIGYRTISALAGQNTDTIHAAIVPKDSNISTFADFVSSFFLYEKIHSQRLAAEELRLLLRQHGVLEGNELYWTMHKALDDYRFAWDNENKTVFVNVG
ncbi:MAG: hypothetical protein ABFD18_06015 [Syntrophomonas sp.]